MTEELDLRGEVCPYTFVKTKLRLEELDSGQDLTILAVNFKTPFCLCDRHSSNLGCGSNARRVAEAIGIDLKIINATKDFLEVLKNPRARLRR